MTNTKGTNNNESCNNDHCNSNNDQCNTSSKRTKTTKKTTFDVCIVGAGPAGLASLSAIQEPYSMDIMNEIQITQANRNLKSSHRKKRSVCVIDPHPTWMASWEHNFETLEIPFLRSPVLAHPDQFDENALFAYATLNHREKDELIESGCFDNRSLFGLGQAQIGLWKLPSTKVFNDFCKATTQRLKHDYIQAKVVSIDRDEDDDDDESDDGNEMFTIELCDGTILSAKAVVLAVGAVGHSIVPKNLQDIPSDKMLSWKQIQSLSSTNKNKNNSSNDVRNVMVVGGGLTAVQAAQYALRQGKRVTLCSRRPLVERHFDIDEDWFDRRKANRCMSEFYHKSETERLELLKTTRGGGSVPPIYMKDIQKWERKGLLTRIVGDPHYVKEPPKQQEQEHSETRTNKKQSIGITFSTPSKNNDNANNCNSTGPVHHFDRVILACGVQQDCMANPLVQMVHKRWPIRTVGGFPAISEDLQWTDNLFVVGSLASLNTGPDSGNIMGMKRAARIVSNELSCRSWLRESRVLGGRFDLLAFDDDDSSDSDSDSDSD